MQSQPAAGAVAGLILGAAFVRLHVRRQEYSAAGARSV
jgi:hypothetical protein